MRIAWGNDAWGNYDWGYQGRNHEEPLDQPKAFVPPLLLALAGRGC
jgi:hypothetical protein